MDGITLLKAKVLTHMYCIKWSFLGQRTKILILLILQGMVQTGKVGGLATVMSTTQNHPNRIISYWLTITIKM
ncbi:hypothetical protein CA598_20060 [Paenibacillus sp. VTT E-133291]|nr:hypothetical protein CA598_20060 [Paenibacillus sp. VTT E-133291]